MNNGFLIPLAKEAEGAAKNILKGYGLGLIKPKFFIIDAEKASLEGQSYERTDVIGYDKKGGIFGLPIWDTLTLVAIPYTDASGKSIPQATLTLDIALFEINNSRNIVKTQIAGRNGTIKEYMSDGDYQIKIRGCLDSGLSNVPPIKLLNDLRVITECPTSISANCNFLDYFLVNEIVIEEAKIIQNEGARNLVNFELSCISDTPFELDA